MDYLFNAPAEPTALCQKKQKTALCQKKQNMKLFWIAARIVVFFWGIPAAFLLSTPPVYPPVDWRLSLIFAASGSVGIFIWFSMMRYQTGIDWSAPYAWDKPFFPSTKYPLRFWLIISSSALIAGAVGLLGGMRTPVTNASMSLMLFVTGAFLLFTIHVWMWLFLKETQQLSRFLGKADID